MTAEKVIELKLRLTEEKLGRERQRIAQVRAVCYKAMAEKDAPGMWLVAQQVLAVLDDTAGEDRPHVEP
ncbi:hypothetical protein ACIBQ1_09745 [Nonomuraea sp. NPDC050153]|uniref:hypothetical protein n=1 Tax=Nonomuraea sp. NPDC050153 TaxID=3364359 RepID=UPI003788DD08